MSFLGASLDGLAMVPGPLAMVPGPLAGVRSRPVLWPRSESQSEAWQIFATQLSVLLCGVVVVACRMGGEATAPKRHKSWMAIILVVWFWTTTTWAAETKRVLNAYQDRSDPQFPLLAFWAAYMPQFFAAAVLSFTVKLPDSPRARGASASQLALWACIGASFWYGQFYTVQSLIHGTPALTFVVKSVEPLTTAVLAIPVLGQPPSLPLLFGICVACVGVALVVTSGGHGGHGGHGGGVGDATLGSAQLAGIGFASLANLGFSSRACLAKLALSKLGLDAFVTFRKMTVAGAQVGIIPGLVWFAAVSLGFGGIELRGSLDLLDGRFELATWICMCMSYLLYQACSILLLSSVAVESHALLVAMKHVTVVIAASILVNAQLTLQAAFGTGIACGGVMLYMRSSRHAGGEGGKEVAEVPPLLVALLLSLVAGGAATPLLTAAWQR